MIKAPTPLEIRLAEVISACPDCPFTIDDITLDGHLALDVAHECNGPQNGIGTVLNRAQKRQLIQTDGMTTRSRSPLRKGGAVKVWHPTEAGLLWAKHILR